MINLSADSPAKRWLVPLFFAGVLGLGLLLFSDYGISNDEGLSRDNGMVTLKYIAPTWSANKVDFAQYYIPLPEFFDRDYGVAFETPVCFLEQLLGIADGGSKFLFRHLCTFLVCFGGLIAVYQLAARRFQDWRLGLLAALWLLLSPRLFAESFYNDKDAVFMALFAIATNTGVLFLLRPTLPRAGWHALACAITIDVRIMGVLLPLATMFLLGWRGLLGEAPWRRIITSSLFYSILLSGLVILFWPYLWPSPLHNFAEAFHKMSSFRWNGIVLYDGSFIAATALPWHYAPVWLGITTPLLYLTTGLLGLILVLWRMLQQKWWRLCANEQVLQDILFLGFFATPLVAVMVLHSVLYDGWRQLYFIYPAFLLLALRGWVAAARWQPHRGWWLRTLYVVTTASLLVTAIQMVHDHPLQNVYFNLLAGSNVEQRFEMDYWGLGYRQDLKYIVEHDTSPVVKIFAPSPSPAELNQLLLPVSERARLQFVDSPEKADYFITNYRFHPEGYPYPSELYQIRADGRRVHSVFRLVW